MLAIWNPDPGEIRVGQEFNTPMAESLMSLTDFARSSILSS